MIFPITMQRLLQNQTFNLGIDKKGIAYKIQINSVHINQIAFKKKEISFIPGTNDVRVLINGFDIDMDIDGGITALWLIPLKASKTFIKNISLQMDLKAPTTDNVNWQLTDNINLDVTDFNITMKNSFLQWCVNKLHDTILAGVKSQLPMAKSSIQSIIDGFNAEMRNRNDTTFLTNVISAKYPLNLTMTQAPGLNGSSQLVTLHFDGLFYDVDEKTTHVGENTVYPNRVEGKLGNSQQIFAHENMLGSLFFGVASQYFPMKINSTNVTNVLLGFFSEIGRFYGSNIKTDLEFNILANDGNFISINKDSGFVLGQKGPADINLLVYCSNETTQRELAVEFTMNLNAIVNASLDNYYIYLNIPQLAIKNV